MKNKLLLIVIIIFTYSLTLKAQIYPDVSGIWKSQNGEVTMLVQDDEKVSFDYNTLTFDQHFEGEFVNMNTIKGTQSRKNKQNNCITYMKLTYVLNMQENEMTLTWEALDNNCDLKAGQSAVVKVYKN